MARIVVDASSVLAVLLREGSRLLILKVTQGAELVSPETLSFEVANALSARMKRRDEQRISDVQASAAFAQFQDMEIQQLPVSRQDHTRALELAALLGIYAYDAYLLTTALSQQAELLTLDGTGRKRGLYQQADKVGVRVVKLEI